MPRRLSDLIRRDLPVDPEILGVTSDSRKVRPGFLFAALPGSVADGRRFVSDAVKAGALAVLATDDLPEVGVPVIRTDDPRRAYALAAANFWENQPGVVVAVTGTNGKTSVAAFCRQIFVACGHKAASMGTLAMPAAFSGMYS